MPVFVTFVAAAVTIALVVTGSAWLGRQAGRSPDVSSEQDAFLVDWLSSHRQGRRVVESLDRRVWGGAMLGLGLAIVIGAVAGIGLLLVDVRTGTAFARLDESAAAWGSDHASDSSTSMLLRLTDLGATKLLIAAMLVIGMIEWVRSRSITPLAFMITVGLGASLANSLLKQLIQRDRPDVVGLVPAGDSWSFPSGHSASAAACWAALALVASREWHFGHRRWAVAVGAGLAVLVATTRVLLAVHWVTDVMAGLVLGWAWCLLVALVFGTKLRQFGDPAARAAGLSDVATEHPERATGRS